MKNTLNEMFLSEYFLHTAVLSKFDGENRRLFSSLADIYLVPQDEREELYRSTQAPSVTDIRTEKDYKRYRRILSYAAMTGTEADFGQDRDGIADIKGSALSLAADLKLDSETQTRGAIYETLADACNDGDICAKRILGIWQCEGIFVAKNERAGLKNLSKAADWNDKGSILALLFYCRDKREYNFARLFAATKNTPFSELCARAESTYGLTDPDGLPETRLLEKAFFGSFLKRDKYDPKYARVVYCSALTLKDKEKAVFNANKDYISTIADLPLKLSEENRQPFPETLFDKTPIERGDERKALLNALSLSDLRNLTNFRPLLIVSDSAYLREMYAEAFLKRRGVHTERIDVADLKEYDLEPTPNNVFVRNVDEDADNCFLLFFDGDVYDGVLSRVAGFLQSGKRGKFHLNSPSVTLDLAEVLPVCFSDRKNAERLKNLCEIIELAEIDGEEMSVAAQDILQRKKKLYRASDIEFSADACRAFDGCGVDDMESAIDGAVRAVRSSRGATLTKEMLKERLGDTTRVVLGFGGNGNDHR